MYVRRGQERISQKRFSFPGGEGGGGAFVDQQFKACLETASFIAAASFAGISRFIVFPFSQVRPFFCQADWSQFPRNQAAEYLQARDRPHFLVGKKLSPGNHADYRDCATMIMGGGGICNFDLPPPEVFMTFCLSGRAPGQFRRQAEI